MTNRVLDAMMEIRASIPPQSLVTTMLPEATELVTRNSFAFLLAVCLDRGVRSEIIWTFPWAMLSRLGHLDPRILMFMTEDELRKVIDTLSYKPRYTRDAPRTILDLCRIVVDEFDGKAQAIWERKGALEVRSTLMRIHGVGAGIAAMGLNLIERVLGHSFGEQEYRYIDVKPDVHLVRVFFRTGLCDVANSSQVVEAARTHSPNFPGQLDAPGWIIGRTWCHEREPECVSCPLDILCPKVGLFS